MVGELRKGGTGERERVNWDFWITSFLMASPFALWKTFGGRLIRFLRSFRRRRCPIWNPREL